MAWRESGWQTNPNKVSWPAGTSAEPHCELFCATSTPVNTKNTQHPPWHAKAPRAQIDPYHHQHGQRLGELLPASTKLSARWQGFLQELGYNDAREALQRQAQLDGIDIQSAKKGDGNYQERSHATLAQSRRSRRRDRRLR